MNQALHMHMHSQLIHITGRRLRLAPALLAFTISGFAGEQPPEPVTPPSPMDWLTGAKPTADIRARYEFGDEEGFDTSHAGTLRSRLGVLSGTYAGVQFFAEYEGTLAADRESYQAASVHGLGQNKTIIADPESHELNQLWLSFDGWIPDSVVKAGRQAINLDGQRYVGGVGWRQNMQTFDAVTISSQPMDELSLWYGYINHVDRIFGSGDITSPAQTDFDGNSHLVHTDYTGLSFGKLTAFAYFLELNNDAGDANSNNSYGLSLTGPLFDEALTYYAEYGYQTDSFDSPLDYGANYFHVNVAAKADPVGLKVGYEYLGSDNGVGYKFPLATLHGFNGFADRFLATPADGLQDAYVSASTKLPLDISGSVYYHKFLSASGGDDLGSEVDLVLAKDLGNGLSVMAKYAYYWSDEDAIPDLQRAILQLEYKF